MKIVYCIASTYNSGGKDRVIINKANWLVDNGYEVYIVTTDQDGRPPYFALDSRVHAVDLGINYEKTNHLPLLKRLLAKREQTKKHTVRLKELLQKISPDILISTFEEDGRIIPQLKLKCPIIAELHYSKMRRFYEYARGRYDLRRLLDWWRTQVDEYTVKQYDSLVVLTQKDLEAWECMPRRKAIPNPISFTTDTPAILQAKKILAVGRYSYEKNFEALIAMWSTLASSFPDWCLEIVGDGYLRERLQALGADLITQGQLVLSASTTAIKEKYLSASILTLTSHYEGFPLVILEAMTCGLPVLAFDCPFGPREIIKNDKVGLLVSMGNELEFVQKLKTLMQDNSYRQQIGLAAYQYSREYSLESVMSMWTELFKSLAK